MRFKKIISGLLACALAVTSVFAVNVISAEADGSYSKDNSVNVSDMLTNSAVVADYDFSKAAGGRLEDKSPYKNDAAVYGKVDCDKDAAIMTLRENSYVALPMAIVDSLTDVESFTVEVKFAKSVACGDESWLFCLGSKADAVSVENTLFFSPNSGRGMGVHVVKKDEEKTLVKLGAARKDRYYTVSMVFDHGKINLYVNGRRVGTAGGLDTGCSMENDIIAAGTENDVLGFIGRSCQAGGSGFVGNLASFKIYDKAMTADEIFADVFCEEEESRFFTQTALAGNRDKQHIVYDLKLPGKVGEYESVVWSSEPNVIASNGKVFNDRDKDTEVRLTATAKRGADLVAARDFTVKVLKLDTRALKTLINKVGKVRETDYTPVTWRPYAAALAKAKQAVTGRSRLGQSDLARLQGTLQNCYAALCRQYKVTVSYGYTGAPSISPLYVRKGDKVDKSKLPQTPRRTGYNFAGWYKGSKPYNFKTPVTKNITITAKWKKIVSPPKASKISKAVNKKGRKLALKFRKSSGAAGYEVSYAANRKFKSARKVRTSKTSVTLKKLKKGVYYVRVRAYKKGNPMVYSAYSKVKKIKISK